MAFLVSTDHICILGHMRSSNASGGSPTTPSSIRTVWLHLRALRGVHNSPRIPHAFTDISPRWQLSISSGTTTASGALLIILGSRDYELPSAPTAGTSRRSTALLRALQRFPPPYFTSGRRLPCSRNLIKLNYASALFAVAPPASSTATPNRWCR